MIPGQEAQIRRKATSTSRPLTDLAIKKAVPRDKPYKITDPGSGVFVLVNPNGSLWIRFRYRFDGKEKLLSLGTYPDTSLAEAREKAADFKKLVRQGIDPSADKKAKRQKSKPKVAAPPIHTFKAVADDFLEMNAAKRAPGYKQDILRRLHRDIFEHIGERPIAEITPRELLDVLKKMEGRGLTDSTHRMRQVIGQIFRYGVIMGYCAADISSPLRGALRTVPAKNRSSVPLAEFPQLLRDIQAYQGKL